MTVPGSVAVVGGGTMGAGIVHVFLAAGSSVVLAEADAERAAIGVGNVEASLTKAQERGKLNAPAAELLSRLSTVEDLAALPADTALVIEAVPEKIELKRSIFEAVARRCPEAVLASNTSSLSIAEIARGLPGERLIGMHFFNPVPVQALVELVVHSGLPGEVVATVRGWAEALGKTVIEVRDSPGFATSRLGVAVGLEAIRMLEEGVASADDIDTGMRLGYAWPMGPLRLTDLVGLDVRLSIADHLAKQLGPRFEAPQLLRDKVARGELGRKTGQGFFSW
ncbi:3-hydroxyacyl-CoA dehydrogenase family protein [Actinokineospora diospyrosa]|uniref:3-hydroxyacyl-CoA dehydrogenase n=1 Tax=Actinokineospora diospyrosa TaxID=103728 RepID=A0ABT1IGN3_9PSEU|nr:3-hydroxyacyl-CoA dehydrogenase family protein [Actinokineospora diospyrosa]MCP2271728.1 3-hydroxyacyl-CoA dehydrogenase (EC 1.1.1.35) [Actinokineospora diospyrosa]